MVLLREFLLSERDEILDNGIRLNAVGNLGRLPGIVRAVLDPLRKESESHDRDDAHARALLRRPRGDRHGRARARAPTSRAASSRPEDVTAEALHGRMPSLARRRSRSRHPHRRRAAHLELPPLRSRLRRAPLRRRALARLRRGGSLRGDRELPASRASLRSRRQARRAAADGSAARLASSASAS